jgi:hypothetical protein
MSTINIDVKNCKECPHFKTANPWSSDGWDRMEDWICSKAEKTIQKAVEWHEENGIEIPDWCPITTNSTLSENDKIEILESLLTIVKEAHPQYREGNWSVMDNGKVWLNELKNKTSK